MSSGKVYKNAVIITSFPRPRISLSLNESREDNSVVVVDDDDDDDDDDDIIIIIIIMIIIIIIIIIDRICNGARSILSRP